MRDWPRSTHLHTLGGSSGSSFPAPLASGVSRCFISVFREKGGASKVYT